MSNNKQQSVEEYEQQLMEKYSYKFQEEASNNKHQTGVDILFNRFLELFLFHEGIPEELQEAYNIAKEVEKTAIVKAVNKGWNYHEDGFVSWMGEQYYEETYGGGEQ